jgi:hypothetical protein
MAVVLAIVIGRWAQHRGLGHDVSGDGEARDLRKRPFKWQRWYPWIGLFAPITVASILGALCLLVSSDKYLPEILSTDDKLELLLIGVRYGAIAGFF